MSIQSTREISREAAIERITTILKLAADRDYVGLESMAYEPDEDIEAFVKDAIELDVSSWTNGMLERIMDRPFYRESMFDNYQVVDPGD